MRISVKRPDGPGRIVLNVLTIRAPWRVSHPGEAQEALLDPGQSPGFLAEGYPDWLRALCTAIDSDRQLAVAIVEEVERRTGRR